MLLPKPKYLGHWDLSTGTHRQQLTLAHPLALSPANSLAPVSLTALARLPTYATTGQAMHLQTFCSFRGFCVTLLHILCAADNKTGTNCSRELTEWNKVNFQMGGVTLAGQVEVSEASAAEQRQLQEAGIQVSALQKAPCSLQVALLPFGDKDESLLFTGWTYKLTLDWTSSTFALKLVFQLLPSV